VSRYKCPLCGYRTISFQGLKMHFQKRHTTDVCPLCGKKSHNITGHYYIVARTHGDSQHLLLFYLSTREVLDNTKKKEVEKLLRGDSN
jgi:hypothetical protein